MMDRVTGVVTALALLSALGFAEEAARPIAVISSGKSVTVDGAAMPPVGSASYPVVEHDEITTQAPTLLTTNDRSIAILDADTRVKIDQLSPPGVDQVSASGGKLFYIYLRQGGMTFDAKGGRMYICASSRLIVPEAHSKGSIRLNPGGAVTLTLNGGTFAEQGKRGCSETGIAGFLSGIAGAQGAAGGAIAPIAGGAIAPIAGASAGVSAGAVTVGAVGLGLGATAGASAFSSTSLNCATAGCNTIPGAVSASQP
jgi:hypothetical protein